MAAVRGTKVSWANVVVRRQMRGLTAYIDSGWVACHTVEATHTEAFDFLSSGGCSRSCRGSFGTGFSHGGTKLRHNAAHHVSALVILLVGISRDEVDGNEMELCESRISLSKRVT